MEIIAHMIFGELMAFTKNCVVRSNSTTNDWVPWSGDYYDQVLIIISSFCLLQYIVVYK